MTMIKKIPAIKPSKIFDVGESPIANMNEVVMNKSKLLEALIENKAKHDVVLAHAIIGYWEVAKAKVAEKQQKLLKQVTEFQSSIQTAIDKINDKIDKKEKLPDIIDFTSISINGHLGLVYPEDHSRDYDRAISMMASSIYEDVRLTVNEFESYVLNNWEWKQSFIASTSFYFDTAKSPGPCVTGQVITGNFNQEYATQYKAASNTAMQCLFSGGLINF